MPHVTFIHGISNKPAADKLLALWQQALAQDLLGHDDGLDLGASGITSSMVYWADVLYDKPLETNAPDGMQESTEAEAALVAGGNDPGVAWQAELPPTEQQVVAQLQAKLAASLTAAEALTATDTPAPAPPASPAELVLERIPLPWFIKEKLMNQFLRDVHHYLFNVSYSPRPGDTYQVQDVIRERTLAALQEGAQLPGPHIVVCHSMGTVIAYDCLMRVPGCPAVDGLLTIGSPLGIDEVQDKLLPPGTTGRRFPSRQGFPPQVLGTWTNVYDPLDPVTGFDGDIGNDFQRDGQQVIEVIKEKNWGKWRHDIAKYLAGPLLRAALRQQLHLKPRS